MTALPLLVIGFLLGVRHATDPDHVVAVSTIVSREKKWSAAGWVGALWGVGHTLTLLLVGGAIVLFGVVIPPRIGLTMELFVAVMLMGLGALNLAGIVPGLVPFAGRSRAGKAARPLVVGVVHGLAGSAAIALLVVTAVRDVGAALAYLVIFSLGTVVGMTLMTSAIAVPFAATAHRSERTNRWMAQATGVMSVLFGLFMAYQVGVHDGLFSGHPVWSPH
ncbi:MAG: high-affinity nickel-transport family protein [Polyangiaceae bacterium]